MFNERIIKIISVVVKTLAVFFIGIMVSVDMLFAQDTLAVIGNRMITTESFAKRYREKLVATGLTDNSDIRVKYLQNLVDDEIMIAHAKQRKMERTAKSKAERTRIEMQELLNAYSEKHLTPTVIVTDSDLKELFIKMNTKVKVRHLYASSREKAEVLYAQLLQGKPFDALAQETFTEPQLRKSGGSLGYISFDEMDPDFENTAFAMKSGEISKPVKTVQGYSIIRVDDIQRNPFVTEYEFARSKERITAYVKKRKYEEKAKEFAWSLRKKLNIRFNKVIIQKMYELTKQHSWQYLIEQPTRSLSQNELRQHAVTTIEETWNVKKLIMLLKSTTKQQRRWIHSEENFEEYIAGLVMRHWINNQAKKEKLDEPPVYREKVQFAFDSYLLETIENDLKEKIRLSNEDVAAYYKTNKGNFAIQPQIRLSSILVENARAADSVKQFLIDGVAFEEISRKFSTQKNTAANGGDMGYFHKNELGDYADNIFSMQSGEWKGPIVEEGKFLFVKCTERRPISYRSFKESRKEIETLLRTEAWHNKKESYIGSLKQGMVCRIYPEKLQSYIFSLSTVSK